MSKGKESQKGQFVKLPYKRTMADAGISQEISILGDQAQTLRAEISVLVRQALNEHSIKDSDNILFSTIQNDIFYHVIRVYRDIKSDKFEDALPMVPLIVQSKIQDILRLRKIDELENDKRELDTSLSYLSTQYKGSNNALKRMLNKNTDMQNELEEALVCIGKLEGEIEDLSETVAELKIDELTGVLNGRRLDFINETIVDKARVTRRLKPKNVSIPVSGIFIDLDNLKPLNDVYGHDVGDRALQIVGEEINEYFRRPTDVCVRAGGDEFFIIAIDCNPKKLKFHIDKLRTKLAKRLKILKYADKQIPYNGSVSIGLSFTEITKHTKDRELQKLYKNLREVADEQMFNSKRKGKGRITFRELQVQFKKTA